MKKKTVSLLFFLALSLCGLAQEHVVVLTEAGTLQQKVAEAGPLRPPGPSRQRPSAARRVRGA